MASDTPVTFTDPAYAIFDVDANGVLTTIFGNLAIYSTKLAAEHMAGTSERKLIVRPVSIKPLDN